MIKKLVLIVFIYFLLAPNISLAGDPYPFQFKQGNLYGSFNAGAMFLEDINQEANTTIGSGGTIDAGANFEFDTGWSIGASLGYIFNDFIRGELNFGYTQVDYDSVTYSGTATASDGTTLASAGGEAEAKGEVSAFYGLTNIILTPLGNKAVGGGNLTPLIGGGIGVAGWEAEIESFTNSNGTLDWNSNESDQNFTANVIAGVEYVHNDNLLIGIRYSRIWINSGKNGAEDAELNNVIGTLSHRF